MENLVSFLDGYEIVGRVSREESGGFKKELFYVRGYHPELGQFGRIRFVEVGLSDGLETELLCCIISWHSVVEVVAAPEKMSLAA